MVEAIHPERRQHPRRPSHIRIRLVHESTGRSFPCLCSDISASGARLLVPAAAPVQSGHAVSLMNGDDSICRVAGLASSVPGGDLAATVARVDRKSLLTKGAVTLGIRFDGAA